MSTQTPHLPGSLSWTSSSVCACVESGCILQWALEEGDGEGGVMTFDPFSAFPLLVGRSPDFCPSSVRERERERFPLHPSSRLSSSKGHIVPVHDSVWAGWMERWCFFMKRCRAVCARGVSRSLFCLCCLSVCLSRGSDVSNDWFLRLGCYFCSLRLLLQTGMMTMTRKIIPKVWKTNI